MEDIEKHYTPIPPVSGGKSSNKFLITVLLLGFITAGFGVFAYMRLSPPESPPVVETGNLGMPTIGPTTTTIIDKNEASVFSDTENDPTITSTAPSEACIKPEIELEVECVQCNG